MSNSEHVGIARHAAYHQMPATDLVLDRQASPLVRGDRRAISGPAPIGVTERMMGHLILRGSPEALSTAVVQSLGLALPAAPLTSSVEGAVCIRWLGPDEWLLTLPTEALAQTEVDLRQVGGAEIALVDVSGGQTLLLIEGDSATQVLMKSTSYDVGLQNFPAGKVVTTTFAQAQVVLRRVNDVTFELVLRRSFADYLWAWLRDAATEYGFAIHDEG
ncbi:MAG: sarcosine oxidase subunit gamma family protein [Pseudomonadales bacterium]|nr:sarcosine oxidase subunit gamma family protein [Pseudomonadales bacterium]